MLRQLGQSKILALAKPNCLQIALGSQREWNCRSICCPKSAGVFASASATTQVESLSPELFVPLSDSAASAGVGTFTPIAGNLVDLSSAHASAAVELFAPSITKALAAIAATGTVEPLVIPKLVNLHSCAANVGPCQHCHC